MESPVLRTPRLHLRAATVDLARADLGDPECFAALLDAEVSAAWPPELYDDAAKRWTLQGAEDHADGLRTYYVILDRGAGRPLLIGTAGFKGRTKNGVSEIGYSLIPEWRGKGLGTELVRALTAHAFAALRAESVCAHTLEELIPSQRVLEKNGYVRRGVPEEDAIRYEIHRSEWS